MSQLEIKDSIRQGDRLPVADFVPVLMQTLIVSCWQPNPKTRPSFADILKCLNSLSGHVKVNEGKYAVRNPQHIITEDTNFPISKNDSTKNGLDTPNMNTFGDVKKEEKIEIKIDLHNATENVKIKVVENKELQLAAAETLPNRKPILREAPRLPSNAQTDRKPAPREAPRLPSLPQIPNHSVSPVQKPVIKPITPVYEKTPIGRYRLISCLSSRRKLYIAVAAIVIFLGILAAGIIVIVANLNSNSKSSSSVSLSGSTTESVASPSPLPTCTAESAVKFKSSGCNISYSSSELYTSGMVSMSGLSGFRLSLGLYFPSGLAFHPDGSSIVSTRNSMINISGDYFDTLPYLNSTNMRLGQFSIASNGKMYVPVSGSGRYIAVVDTNTSVASVFAGDVSASGYRDSTDLLQAQFLNPIQTLIYQGQLYILDKNYTGPAYLRVVDLCPYTLNPGVRTVLNFTDNAQLPRAFAIDDEGAIFYSTEDNCVNKYFPSNETTISCFVGIQGSAVGSSQDGPPGVGVLEYPRGLAFDKCGNLFIAEYGASLVRAVDKDRFLHTVSNGAYRPLNLAFSAEGSLYLTDVYSIVKVIW